MFAIEYDDEELICCGGCERFRPPSDPASETPELCQECADDVTDWRIAAQHIWTEGGAA